MCEQLYFESVETTKNYRNILLDFVELAIISYDKFIYAFILFRHNITGTAI